MFNQNKKEVTESNQAEEKKEKSGYVNWWLFRKKGTVSKSWATAEELWNNPKVRKEIEHHNNKVREEIEHHNNKVNKQSKANPES